MSHFSSLYLSLTFIILLILKIVIQQFFLIFCFYYFVLVTIVPSRHKDIFLIWKRGLCKSPRRHLIWGLFWKTFRAEKTVRSSLRLLLWDANLIKKRPLSRLWDKFCVFPHIQSLDKDFLKLPRRTKIQHSKKVTFDSLRDVNSSQKKQKRPLSRL